MLNDFLKNTPNLGIPNLKYGFDTKLGTVLSDLYQIAFLLASFLAFFWFCWGAFQYIFAGGDKEKIAKARSRITWSIIGLIIVALAFALAQFAQQILKPTGGTPIL